MPKKGTPNNKKSTTRKGSSSRKKTVTKKLTKAQKREQFEEKILACKMSPEDELQCLEKLDELHKENYDTSSEAHLFLKNILALPWGKKSRLNRDIPKAKKILEEEHFGLKKVKEHIIEHLSMIQMTKKKSRGQMPIICLVGPPGVGKTSIAEILAKATGRKYARAALGGVNSEAYIRGWAKSYTGAAPGAIIKGIQRAGTSNPLFLLDEIDKMSSGTSSDSGDPTAALLEVLDSAQNSAFRDHNLDTSYDLSDVMFVCTANNEDDIPPALKDRLEIIRLPSYTPEEKLEIATRYIMPRATKDTELEGKFSIDGESLKDLIDYHTREAGVRNLDQKIRKLARKASARILDPECEEQEVHIHKEDLKKYAGAKEYDIQMAKDEDTVGAVSSLWASSEGGGLFEIEAELIKKVAKGTELSVVMTGVTGDTTTQSIEKARTYVLSHAEELGIDLQIFKDHNLHIDSSTLVEGPSAGLSIVTAIVSRLTGIPVRKDIAMTGEVWLQGQAKPIGGLQEKIMAAKRAGIKKILLPKGNYDTDFTEIEESLLEGLEIIPVTSIKEVLKHALVEQPSPKVQYINTAEQLVDFPNQNRGARRVLQGFDSMLQKAFDDANAEELEKIEKTATETVEGLKEHFNLAGSNRKYKFAVRDSKDNVVTIPAAIRRVNRIKNQ